MPDPFVLAVILTFVTLVWAFAATEFGAKDLVSMWGGKIADGKVSGKGIWSFLGFGMMMCLILVTGHALASARASRRLIRHLAALPGTSSQAIALTAVVAMTAALINWGLGIIVGALLARDMALSAKQRGIRVHYPLLAAAGYTGLLVWHGGLSGTAPLSMTQEATARKVLAGAESIQTVPLTETIFSPLNLAVTAAVFLLVPFILVRMQPKAGDAVEVDPDLFQDRDDTDGSEAREQRTPASVINNSPMLGAGLGVLGLAYLVIYVREVGLAGVDLNRINLLFLSIGLLVYGRPIAYAKAIGQAVKSCSGIILQFPIYAGIMAVMVESGLVAEISDWIRSISNAQTYGPLTFLSAGGVNVLVPSGGGQFGVQGPVVLQSAAELGVPYGKAIMAFAYGDQWTNMLQPFWALPLLGITKLPASRIIGYTGAVMFLVMPIYIIALTVF